MTTDAENNLNRHGHFHGPTHTAEIIQFPLPAPNTFDDKEIIEIQNETPSMTFRISMGVAALYSTAIVGYTAYTAYESLEGKDVLYANTVGGVAVAGSVAFGATWIVNKFRR
jgi:hypothetical protein